jgi:hypothetical protein
VGLKKKEEFWDHVRQFEIVGLVEERSKEKIEKLLPKKNKSECQGEKRKQERESCGGNKNGGEIGD